jgi:hypothetical protein
MPYVEEKVRVAIEPNTGRPAATEGELNFQITRLLIKYAEAKGLSYSTINDILGALDGAGKEFYRRIAVPYEEGKLALNGDVYEQLSGGIHEEVDRSSGGDGGDRAPRLG